MEPQKRIWHIGVGRALCSERAGESEIEDDLPRGHPQILLLLQQAISLLLLLLDAVKLAAFEVDGSHQIKVELLAREIGPAHHDAHLVTKCQHTT